MSIIKCTDEGYIISHLSFINKIYNNVNNIDNKKTQLNLNDKLFKLISQYLRDNQVTKVDEISIKSKKRKRKNPESSSSLLHHPPSSYLNQIEFIHKKFTNIMTLEVRKEFFNISDNAENNNIEARTAADNFYQISSSLVNKEEPPLKFHGSNTTDSAIVKKINNTCYVFPSNCKFYSYDVRTIGQRLELIKQFDFILMDPPWWNKFIRRKKMNKQTHASYEMMYNSEFVDIPIDKLLKSTDGIIGIWCTNCKSHLDYIVNKMLPAWGMKLLATWYWVKVTQSGETICNFNYNMAKQPYELLIFAGNINNTTIKIPNDKLLISVPSSVHSHKPPLTEVIASFLPENPNCLELFARYLLPGWTSWGLEVLKFQNTTLYSE